MVLASLHERLPPNFDECLLKGKLHPLAETLASSATTLLSSLTIRQFGHLVS
jgi:hypothetical protein